MHFHAPPIKVPPCPKEVLTVPEELLYKLNRQPIELKPPKKKYIPRVDLSEEEQQPCLPEKQYYSDICYGKIEAPNPALEEVKQEEIPCQMCTDNYTEEETTDCPCELETEEDCESDEEMPDEALKDEEEDVDSNEASEEIDLEEESGEEEAYRKRSIRPSSFGRSSSKIKN